MMLNRIVHLLIVLFLLLPITAVATDIPDGEGDIAAYTMQGPTSASATNGTEADTTDVSKLLEGTLTSFEISEPCNTTHRLRPAQWIVPAAIVGFSAMWTGDHGWMAKQRNKLQGDLSPQEGSKTSVDSYLRFAPIAGIYGLDLIGVKARHNFVDRTMILAISTINLEILTQGLKYSLRERRPDGSKRNSFPSGHAGVAFMGAEMLRQEYAHVSPWIGYAGYAVAATTAYLRIYNNRHYLNDVLAGAAIGYASTRLAYWMYPRLFKRFGLDKSYDSSTAMMPFYDGRSAGMSMVVTF